MKDRFALAILASIALHLLLLEVVSALEFLWPAARQANERQIIAVSLVEMDNPAEPLVRQEGTERASAELSSLDRIRAGKHARNATASPRKALDKLSACPEAAPDSAQGVPQSTQLAEPTDRLYPEAEVRQSQGETPAAAVAAVPNDDQLTQGLVPTQGAGLCAPAAGPEGTVNGAGRADGGSSGGDAAGGGGQSSGKAGEGAVLVPGEFLAGNPPPRYPLIARRKGWEGTVVIDIQVSGDGWVRAARIEKSSSYTVLDDAALGAVRNWRIAPSGSSDGTDLKFRVPVVFRLTQM